MTVETWNASIFSFFVKGRELTTYLSLEVEELTHWATRSIGILISCFLNFETWESNFILGRLITILGPSHTNVTQAY